MVVRCEWNGCGAEFRSRWALRRHAVVHTGDRRWVCVPCAKAFATSCDLRRHRRETAAHSAAGEYACAACDKTFRSRTSLLEHEETHLEPRAFQCVRCARSPSYANRSALRLHVVLEHGADRQTELERALRARLDRAREELRWTRKQCADAQTRLDATRALVRATYALL